MSKTPLLKKLIDSGEHIAAIYAIINKKNWKMYVGSTTDLKDRWKNHNSGKII